MKSDKDIFTWDQRLKDQADRGWENYIHRRIDLSIARVDEILIMPGDFLYVEDSSDDEVAVAKVKIQNVRNDQLDLEQGVEIHTVFTQVYISNEALQDEWLDLVFGINFIYKKKIGGDGDGFVNPIVTAPGVDLVLLPGAGGISQIGDAGAQSRGLVANDDLFVSGKLEVDGMAYFDARAYYYDQAYYYHMPEFFYPMRFWGAATTLGCNFEFRRIDELLTIAVGTGAAGVVTAGNLAPANSTIIGVGVRVNQAPGGGATTIDIGRTGGGNLDEFIDGIATALGTTGTLAGNHDAATTGPVLNAADNTLTLTTDADVLVTDMKVRIVVFYRPETPPTT